jgi:hypothetical protein
MKRILIKPISFTWLHDLCSEQTNLSLLFTRLRVATVDSDIGFARAVVRITNCIKSEFIHGVDL